MNIHHDYHAIENHIRAARQMRSAVLGRLIGDSAAEAWRGIGVGYRWVVKKVLDFAHALPTAPTH